jgi:hypothetical protein
MNVFFRSVRAKGAVEMWLSNVEAHMFETVKRYRHFISILT